jgi:lysozyme
LCGVDLIKSFEGCHLNAYPDPLTGGLPITIGWGSTKDFDGTLFKMGKVITQKYADTLLEFDLKNRYLPSLQRIPYWNELNDYQRGALLSFAYNLGADFYNQSGFDTITRVLKNKEWNKVPDALYLYRNPGTKVEAGLTRRRVAEGDLWSKK